MTDLFRKPVIFMFSEPVFFVPAVLPILVSIVFLLLGVASIGAMFSGHSVAVAGGIFVLMVSAVVVFLAEFLAHSVLVHMAYTMEAEGKVDLGESFNVAWEKLGIVLIAASVISISAAIGFFLLIIPGLVVIFFTIFTVQEIILADKGVREAITGSFEIVKANFGNVLGFFILLAIIVLLVQGILQLIPGVGNIIATLLTTPYTAIATTLFYMELQAEGVKPVVGEKG